MRQVKPKSRKRRGRLRKNNQRTRRWRGKEEGDLSHEHPSPFPPIPNKGALHPKTCKAPRRDPAPGWLEAKEQHLHYPCTGRCRQPGSSFPPWLGGNPQKRIKKSQEKPHRGCKELPPPSPGQAARDGEERDVTGEDEEGDEGERGKRTARGQGQRWGAEGSVCGQLKPETPPNKPHQPPFNPPPCFLGPHP